MTTNDEYLIVLPSINGRKAAGCLRSMHQSVRDRTLLIDNAAKPSSLVHDPPKYAHVSSPHNAGVARSWNMGVAKARELGVGWLVLLSTSIRFGAGGGRDIAKMIANAPLVDPCAGALGRNAHGTETHDIGWHLHAFRMSVFDVVGTFDENFFPAYFEDTDFLYRMGLAGLASPRENGRTWNYTTIDCILEREADALKSKLVDIEFGRLAAYYERKWGGQQGGEKFTVPFHLEDPTVNWSWWP